MNQRESIEEKMRKKLFRKISGTAIRTMLENNMVVNGDRVLAALSGGKDSMIMLEVLAGLKKSARINFTLDAVHVEVEGTGYEAPEENLEIFCRQSAVPYHVLRTRLELKDPKKSPCFVCSWQRRKMIFDLSRELGSTKIAFGHHRDDALQTLLMNMVYHGSISSLPYSLSMFSGRIELIRPLLDTNEAVLKEYARLAAYSRVEKSCIFEDVSKREAVKEILNRMEELCEGSRTNLFKSCSKIIPEYLPGAKIKQ